MNASYLKECLMQMSVPSSDHLYYAITLTANKEGNFQWEMQTKWVGFSKATPKRELRIACEVSPAKMIAMWQSIQQPYTVVTTVQDLSVFMVLGGNALIEIGLAKDYFDFVETVIEVAPDGIYYSIEISRVPTAYTQRAPTPKARMEVIKRDKHRCVICGRRPADCVDIELNVHHIRPWAMGGLTKRNNLITICRACHKGLEPHFDLDLYGLIQEASKDEKLSLNELNNTHFDGLRRYRHMIIEMVRSEIEEDANHQTRKQS
ncbi:MAG: HNH endonuclease [Kiritimatiellia bacterium]